MGATASSREVVQRVGGAVFCIERVITAATLPEDAGVDLDASLVETVQCTAQTAASGPGRRNLFFVMRHVVAVSPPAAYSIGRAVACWLGLDAFGAMVLAATRRNRAPESFGLLAELPSF